MRMKSPMSALCSLSSLLKGEVGKVPNDPFSVLLKWGIYRYEPETLRVGKRLERFWQRLSPEQQWLLLRTAKCVAEAEQSKNDWNPKSNRHRYERLAHDAVAAAKLAENLGNWFPPPWDDEHAAIGAFIGQLVSFVDSALAATSGLNKNVSALVAHRMLRRLNRSIARKVEGMPWQLIRSLAWLASGKKLLGSENSERTVRRLFERPPNLSKSPAADCWSRNWDLVQRVARLVPGRQSDQFENLLEHSLKTHY